MNEYVVNARDIAWEDRTVDWVYIGRPSSTWWRPAQKSTWGNPWTHRDDRRAGLAKHVVATRAEAIAKYEEYVRSTPHLMAALRELRGKVLGCWCAPLPCHGDVLVRLLRETEPT